ncbi:MAG: hypothetical protein ACK2UK_06900 [Candidatus Promineifilaceae bacterium]
MENRKRITNILIAGSLTLLILAVFFAFRGGSETTAALEAAAASEKPTVELQGSYDADIAALQAQVEDLQAQNDAYAKQNEELRAAMTTLQQRESAYLAQIKAANQTINQLSAQGGSQAQGELGFGEPGLGEQGEGDQGFGAFGSGQRAPHEHTHWN